MAIKQSYCIDGRTYCRGTVVYDPARLGRALTIAEFYHSPVDGATMADLRDRGGRHETCEVSRLPDVYSDLPWLS